MPKYSTPMQGAGRLLERGRAGVPGATTVALRGSPTEKDYLCTAADEIARHEDCPWLTV